MQVIIIPAGTHERQAQTALNNAKVNLSEAKIWSGEDVLSLLTRDRLGQILGGDFDTGSHPALGNERGFGDNSKRLWWLATLTSREVPVVILVLPRQEAVSFARRFIFDQLHRDLDPSGVGEIGIFIDMTTTEHWPL